MRPSLLTLPLLIILPLAVVTYSFAKTGGIGPGEPGCSKNFTSQEHHSWAQQHFNSNKLSQKVRRKNQRFIRCSKNENHRKRMKLYWKRVKRSVLPKNHDLWIRIARCEQPGRGYKGVYWSHPGPTYQGGLGFWYGTWDTFKYPGMPNNAGRATWRQQMRVANRLYERYGTSPWGCA